jgi:Domain of unknown function (DUF305)
MSNRGPLLRLVMGLGLGALILVGPDPGPGPVSASSQHQHGSGYEGEMRASMETMMQAMESAPHSGMPEADFLAMMIPHHQGAIDMARALLLYGRDPLVRQLAEEIITTQQVEIQSMQNRLEILRAGRAPDVAADQALDGTRGDSQPAHPQHPQ